MQTRMFARSIFAAALLLAGGMSASAQQPGGAPPPVTVAKPLVKKIIDYDEFTGRFEPIDAVEVRSRVGGYLQSVDFEDGAYVNKGDLLFVIDRRPFKATLDQAEATLVSAQARLKFAQADLERAQSLSRSGNISDQLLDQRQQNFLTAKADIDGAEAAVRQARLDYEFTEIRAPISGRIGRKLVSVGNLVTANTTLLTTIVSRDPIYFYFDLDERSFLAYNKVFNLVDDSMTKTRPVEVKIALTDDREPSHTGTLDFVDNRMDQATGTMRARAIVKNPDFKISPGLFGRVLFPGSPEYEAVLIPDEAVATDQDRRLVWVVADDGTVSPRIVRLGPKSSGYRVIRDGLKGDETIVVVGLQRVRPGGKVTPQMSTLPPQRQ
ncbi:MAG: efflux RND transporter periplasmic adaptor subunit [Chelatococcus sp.]|nr:efflux RND transporter periplasmic adaptor subunit [Chelatococcus sp. YT9]MBX3556677.1 efflux RND transporter periplasmic adaptor subunit [Chelatococcus sp.]